MLLGADPESVARPWADYAVDCRHVASGLSGMRSCIPGIARDIRMVLPIAWSHWAVACGANVDEPLTVRSMYPATFCRSPAHFGFLCQLYAVSMRRAFCVHCSAAGGNSKHIAAGPTVVSQLRNGQRAADLKVGYADNRVAKVGSAAPGIEGRERKAKHGSRKNKLLSCHCWCDSMEGCRSFDMLCHCRR